MALRLDLTSALSRAHTAMDLAVEHVLGHRPRQIRYKGDRDPVSDVDETVERLVHQFLATDDDADTGFLGEETGPIGNRDTYWVLDPIDGTINHQHGNPLCAIALGLVHNGQPALGVIALPLLGHRYSAAESGGAFRDDEPITPSSTDRLDKALIGFGDYGSGTDAGLRDVLCASLDRSFTARAQGLRRYGSTALDLVWVADGTLDACVLLGNRTWDTAAGAVIAREAGALVLDSDATPHSVHSRCAVAVTPGLSKDVMPLLRLLRGSSFWPSSNKADLDRLASTTHIGAEPLSHDFP
ncbi:inositol monophosphatase family protein [Amycolatopsis umgeniensis]|uniref:inositol-phosphate phosphatase n=1 Tax=Amycolatopsis umgeniensis TaxID=336628 RepID=A0A841BC06_9PSEU|nr:inositol monophosphatase family protein [Amycolatopsis umgeniensis]MBB5856365.1 myo-inositol-1(or 4)-monophosphatase [Amycolatopsis umgeniensis]